MNVELKVSEETARVMEVAGALYATPEFRALLEARTCLRNLKREIGRIQRLTLTPEQIEHRRVSKNARARARRAGRLQ